MITTNVSHGGNFIVTADDPAGPWSEPLWLRGPAHEGIDPSLFFEDGKTYLTGTGGPDGIRLVEVDLTTGESLGAVKTIWRGTGGAHPEGPHLYKVGGWYYLMIAEGGTEYGHMQTIARSRAIDGSYDSCPHNPILTHRSLAQPLQALGHADLVQSPDGRWWIVFHAIRPVSYPPYHQLGRETCLAPVEWVDGWPVVNGGEPIGLEMLPTGLPGRITVVPGQPFDPLVWAYLRNPVAANYRRDSDRIGLVGDASTLSDLAPTTFLGRRQCEFVDRLTVSLEFSPVSGLEEAGVTVFMNEGHHYDLAVKGRRLIVRRKIGDLEAIVYDAPAPSDPIELIIESDPETYRLSYTANGETSVAAEASARYLGTETSGGFTGVFFALYATGNGQPSKSTAWFRGRL